MRGALFEFFGGPIAIVDLPDPVAPETGVVLKVEATGICRSDWHGWMGHDPDIRLPHVPGHELVGTIIELGKGVRNWKPGQRVTMPFVAGCGHCEPCLTGNQQVCDHQFQPGFTHWGSFAQYVAIHYADMNLVHLPEGMDSMAAASLGCRMATAYRAVTAQGQIRPGDWVAIHGAGGVGLSAVAIASALGARPLAIDVRDEPLELAKELGAVAAINAREVEDVPVFHAALYNRWLCMTRAPSRAAATAAANPAGPPPATKTSTSAITGISRAGSVMVRMGYLPAGVLGAGRWAAW